MGRKKARFYADQPSNTAPADTNHALILPNQKPCTQPHDLTPTPQAPQTQSKKKRLQLEKYLQRKLKLDQRPLLMKQLSEQKSLGSNTLQSTKDLLLPSKQARGLLSSVRALPAITRNPQEEPDAAEEQGESKGFDSSSTSESDNDSFGEAAVEEIDFFSRKRKAVDVSDDDDKGVDGNSPSSSEAEEFGPTRNMHPDLLNQETVNVSVERSSEMEEQRSLLPVYQEEQHIMETIKGNPVSIVCGETGSGKTTQIPQFLYEYGFGSKMGPNPGLIGCTQPRRVATTSMSSRVGQELNDPSLVGYTIRQANTCTLSTKIKFMTDGILLNEIEADFLLSKYSVILLDEAHERGLNGDILLGMLSRIVKLRLEMWRGGEGAVLPLRLVIMSATLDIDSFLPLFSQFCNPPVIRVPGRQFPVTIHHARRTAPDYISAAHKMIRKVHKRLPEGGILVFMPGKYEIEKLSSMLNEPFDEDADDTFGDDDDERGRDDYCPDVDFKIGDDKDVKEQEIKRPESNLVAPAARKPSKLHILPFYSSLDKEEQSKVWCQPPPNHRLCILSTNIAETSVTLPGIRYVVDCGLSRQRWEYGDVGELKTDWCSKASAAQRAGRAGRIGPGHCYRLYSSAVFDQQFPEHSRAEIERGSVDGLVLKLVALGIERLEQFPLPTPIPQNKLASSLERLCLFGAIVQENEKIRISDVGRKMVKLPLSPLWSRFLLAAQDEWGGCEEGSTMVKLCVYIAAIMSIGEYPSNSTLESTVLDSDILSLLAAFLHTQNTVPSKEMHHKLREIQVQYEIICSHLNLNPNTNPKSIRNPKEIRKLLCRFGREARRLPSKYRHKHMTAYAIKLADSESILPTLDGSTKLSETESIAYLHAHSHLAKNPPPHLSYHHLVKNSDGIYILKSATCSKSYWPSICENNSAVTAESLER